MPTQWQLVFLGNAYYIAGRYAEALAYFKQLQEMDLDNLWAYITPASIYGQLGREKEAHAAAKKLLRLDPNFSVKHWEKKARPPPKTGNSKTVIDTSDSQLPSCEDHLYCDPEYPIEAYGS